MTWELIDQWVYSCTVRNLAYMCTVGVGFFGLFTLKSKFVRAKEHFYMLLVTLGHMYKNLFINSTPWRFPSYLLLALPLYFLFIFYLPRCTLRDFPSVSTQASLLFLSCCHRTTTYQWLGWNKYCKNRGFFFKLVNTIVKIPVEKCQFTSLDVYFLRQNFHQYRAFSIGLCIQSLRLFAHS